MADQQPRLRSMEELQKVRAALALEWRKTELEVRMHQTHAEMLNLNANQHLPVQNPAQNPVQNRAHALQSGAQQQGPRVRSASRQSSTVSAVQDKQSTPLQSVPQQDLSRIPNVPYQSSSAHALQESRAAPFQPVPQPQVPPPPNGPYRSSTVPVLQQGQKTSFQAVPQQATSPFRDVSCRASVVPDLQHRKGTPHDWHTAPQPQVQHIPDDQDLTPPHGPFISLPFRKWDVLLCALQTTPVKKPQKLPPCNVTPLEYLQEQPGEVNELQSDIGGGPVQHPRKRVAPFELAEDRPQHRRRVDLDPQNRHQAPILEQSQKTLVYEPDSESMFVQQHSHSPEDNQQCEDDDTICPLPSLPETKTPHVTPPKPLSPNELMSPQISHPSAQSFVGVNIPKASAPSTIPVPINDPNPASLSTPHFDTNNTRSSPPRPFPRGRPPRSVAYQVVEHGSLPARTRRALELRYCAHVARMLASKSCVKDPPLPLSSKNLWERMRQRLRRAASQASRSQGHGRVGVGGEDTDGYHAQGQGQASEQDHEQNQLLDGVDQEQAGYTSAIDFEQDVRNMLMDYVRMGPCSNGHCPYARSGNSQYMCWRMRLEAVLDEKMRGLKRCIRECEQGFAGGDQQGMNEWVDSWFAGDFGVIKDDVE